MELSNIKSLWRPTPAPTTYPPQGDTLDNWTTELVLEVRSSVSVEVTGLDS